MDFWSAVMIVTAVVLLAWQAKQIRTGGKTTRMRTAFKAAVLPEDRGDLQEYIMCINPCYDGEKLKHPYLSAMNGDMYVRILAPDYDTATSIATHFAGGPDLYEGLFRAQEGWRDNAGHWWPQGEYEVLSSTKYRVP
jgi:hypothetical protein